MLLSLVLFLSLLLVTTIIMMDITNANALSINNTNSKKHIHNTFTQGRESIMEYEVTLSTGTWFLLAKDSMSAAYAALELSKERNSKLINVRLNDEW